MLTRLAYRVPVLFKSALDRKLDAPDLLTQDHMKVESALLQIKILSQVAARLPSRRLDARERRTKLFEQVRADLEAHMKAEESVFYPECSKLEDLKEKIQDGVEEHHKLRSLLGELNGLSDESDEEFDSKLNELAQCINHHVSDEENKVFPKVRKLFSRTRLEKLASAIRASKGQGRPRKAKPAAA